MVKNLIIQAPGISSPFTQLVQRILAAMTSCHGRERERERAPEKVFKAKREIFYF